MENQGFNYELEAEKISDLFNQNYKLGLEAKNSFRNKTKFSLDEVLEYLIYSISKANNEKWTIRKVASFCIRPIWWRHQRSLSGTFGISS